jgi:hypothetical protein
MARSRLRRTVSAGQALQQFLGLFDGQPIADPHANVLSTLDAADAGSKFRTQQACVVGFIRKPAKGAR